MCVGTWARPHQLPPRQGRRSRRDLRRSRRDLLGGRRWVRRLAFAFAWLRQVSIGTRSRHCCIGLKGAVDSSRDPRPRQDRSRRDQLTDHAMRHARAQLRAAGTPRPPDHEALLATYVDRQRAPDPEPQLCTCGCGQPIPTDERRGQPRKYIDETHRKRATPIRGASASSLAETELALRGAASPADVPVIRGRGASFGALLCYPPPPRHHPERRRHHHPECPSTPVRLQGIGRLTRASAPLGGNEGRPGAGTASTTSGSRRAGFTPKRRGVPQIRRGVGETEGASGSW